MSDSVYFTKKDLISVLENIDDDCRIGIRCCTPLSGNVLCFDLEVGITTDSAGEEVLYVSSDGLDEIILADVELLKEEM